MVFNSKILILCALGFLAHSAAAGKPASMADVLLATSPGDWRPLDPENTLYVELAAGRVVIELAPEYAPLHAANIKALARAHYYDGLSVVRVQDNYVAQWGDPDNRRRIPPGILKVAAEFDSPLAVHQSFVRLPDGDVYAPEVGFSAGFPAARDPKRGLAWLAHCYAMVGAGRDDDAMSNGAELYVVIGHAPRHLDRNVALVGRVVKGIELLASLPRGGAEMGFYSKTQAPLPIRAIRVAADIPVPQRSDLELLRTESPAFAALVESRRNRPEAWFKVQAGHIDLCNVPLVVRERLVARPHSS